VRVELIDRQGLLADNHVGVGDISDDDLLAQLGIDASGAAEDITILRHVRSAEEKRAAEEIANRQKCEDFDEFRPVFERVQDELSSGLRQTRRFERESEIAPGRFYILGGQKA
jgi:hypothetical protein